MYKIWVAIFLLFISCNKTETVNLDIAPYLNVTLSLKSDKDDVLKVMFNGLKTPHKGQVSLYVVNQDLEASDAFKEYNFSMFSDDHFETLKINLGNLNTKTILINKAKITYKDKSVLIHGEDFFRYFRTNIYAVFDSADKSKIITKKTNNRHVPTLSLKRMYLDRLFGVDLENY